MGTLEKLFRLTSAPWMQTTSQILKSTSTHASLPFYGRHNRLGRWIIAPQDNVAFHLPDEAESHFSIRKRSFKFSAVGKDARYFLIGVRLT